MLLILGTIYKSTPNFGHTDRICWNNQPTGSMMVYTELWAGICFHWSISIICLMIVLKPAITVFTCAGLLKWQTAVRIWTFGWWLADLVSLSKVDSTPKSVYPKILRFQSYCWSDYSPTVWVIVNQAVVQLYCSAPSWTCYLYHHNCLTIRTARYYRVNTGENSGFKAVN